MNDYFDHIERELRTAVRARAHLPWYVRLRLRHSRALVVVLAGMIIAGPALAAVSLLHGGSPVVPNGPRTPNAFNGVAVPKTVEMLPLRTADPAGGLPWGMRLIRTTRGLLCVQIGRAAFGTVGAVGRDDAFTNDGRFHPFSVDYQPDPNACVVPDGHGNGFLNVAEIGIPGSALFINGRSASGCIPYQTAARANASAPTHVRPRHRPLPACPAADLREIYYGLLGPDAVSVTHLTSAGGLATTPTVGPDGAYLIVLPDRRPTSQNDTSTYGSSPFAGSIREVAYRNGRTCRLPVTGGRVEIGQGSCPLLGYTPTGAHAPTVAQVRTPITARILPSTRYCDEDLGEVVIACPGALPPGFRAVGNGRGPAITLVQISFISRVPITNSHSYYYIQMTRAPYTDPRYARGGNGEQCGPDNGDFGQTNFDYAAGERVTFSMFESLSCRGPIHGDVSLVIDTGPSTQAPMPAVKGQSLGRDVGHFTVNVP